MKRKIALFLTALLVISTFSLASCGEADEIKKEDPVTKYLASDTFEVPVYEITENEEKEQVVTQSSSMIRGSSVSVYPTPIVVDEVSYALIDEPAPEDSEEEVISHYLRADALVDSADNAVREKECFVRTPVTVYENPDTPDIASFFKKGTALEITGFDSLREDGSVEMYKVRSGEKEGYVYSKYLVFSQEEADANYKKYYKKNKNKKYSSELYGGLAKHLDYYPYDKSFDTDKEIPAEARTFYLNVGTIDYIDDYIELAKECGCNAFVIDIKDGGLAYHAEVAKEYSKSAFKTSYHDNSDYKKAIDKVREAGIWAIGRIVVFNDEHFAKDNPKECIYNNGVNQEWPSAFSRKAWEYNVKLAVSAVEEMGFDEIQFDYVRFPEDTFFIERDGHGDFQNKYKEEKAQAIQNFCFYAADQIHKAGAYFSVDVFGECSNGYVTAYGQYWPAISMIVDAISSMPYVDHFGRDVDTWTDAYSTVYNWAVQAADAQKITPNPAIPRTWLTCYSVPHWDPVIPCDSNFLGKQVQALWDAGIGEGGFITWNAASGIGTYYDVSEAFSRKYKAN